MIFVTVGTHEQQFNRLVKAVDELRADGILTEPVFIQTGYSTYEPIHCDHSRFVPFHQMKNYMEVADVVITHGALRASLRRWRPGRSLLLFRVEGTLANT